MKTICDLSKRDFLVRCNKLRHAVSDVIKDTGIMELRKVQPEFTGDETPEQREEKIRKQGAANIDKMVDRLLEEKPDETIELVQLMLVPETGENVENISGIDLLNYLMQILADKRVMDFFLSLMRLAEIGTAN